MKEKTIDCLCLICAICVICGKAVVQAVNAKKSRLYWWADIPICARKMTRPSHKTRLATAPASKNNLKS